MVTLIWATRVLGAREHPTARIGSLLRSVTLADLSQPHAGRHRDGDERDRSQAVPLWKRRGVACLASDRFRVGTQHAGLRRRVLRDNTGTRRPLKSENAKVASWS